MSEHRDGPGTPAAPGTLAQVRDRIRARVVGRERELDLMLAAVAAGRGILPEGPPGTSKPALLRAITAGWGIPLVFVEGNAGPTPAKLVGHRNPARVLREDYSAGNFADGPLLPAMRSGGFLYIEEFNRAPEDTLNTLRTAMAERGIVALRAPVADRKPAACDRLAADAVAVTRTHEDVRQGSSVRGATGLTLVAGQLLTLWRGVPRAGGMGGGSPPCGTSVPPG